MADYPQRYAFLAPRHRISDMPGYIRSRSKALDGLWQRDYRLNTQTCEIVGIRLAPFEFMFDAAGQRLVAASGIVGGRHWDKREQGRQRGHPRPENTGDVKGHAIAHSIGGGFDINIFPQDGKLNGGVFRQLENIAMETPDAFYFVHLIYDGAAERPKVIEQGLLRPSIGADALEIRVFEN